MPRLSPGMKMKTRRYGYKVKMMGSPGTKMDYINLCGRVVERQSRRKDGGMYAQELSDPYPTWKILVSLLGMVVLLD